MMDDASGSSERPSKRFKQASTTGQDTTTRHSKACANCRRLKVKCDVGNTQHASQDCSRCSRLSLQCLRESKSWTASNQPDAVPLQLTITKLERALEDILERLEMPALDLYTSPAIVPPRHEPQASRPNSEERDVNAVPRDVSPDPINSLIEATRLNGLRSQLRSAKQRRKGGMRRKDHDLISEKLVTEQQAEGMLDMFQRRQSEHLFSAGIPVDATVDSLRASSTVLFTAVCLVAAFHTPGQETLHETIHGHFMGLVSSVMWDRFHTLDDIRGLCIAALWQPYLSWKLSGLSIRMATELNLHHAFYSAFSDQHVGSAERMECLEKTRLWYLLYVLDHQFSIAYGRPSSMRELRPIKDFELLLRSDECTQADRALIAQVTGLVALSRAFDHFGLNPRRAMTGDDDSILHHSRFADSIQAWHDRWIISSSADGDVKLQFNFSNLVLHSLVLRGRPLAQIAELPHSLRPLALKAVEAAHAVLHHFVDSPALARKIVGVPLYIHSMIAFAVVFLLKLATKWQQIGITIDPQHVTLPLVSKVARSLQSCQAGASHMVFSMAKGFERMLRKVTQDQSAETRAMQPRSRAVAAEQQPDTPLRQPVLSPLQAIHSGYDNDVGSRTMSWDFQDEELWSVGMGFDLLAPGSQALDGLDTFEWSAW